MCEFKVGDRVVMYKPRTECLIHKGVVGIILEMDEWYEPILQIDTIEDGGQLTNSRCLTQR